MMVGFTGPPPPHIHGGVVFRPPAVDLFRDDGGFVNSWPRLSFTGCRLLFFRRAVVVVVCLLSCIKIWSKVGYD